jgi:branched-chain amino acid transport system ATP-binding protein
MIKLKNITKQFGGIKAINNLSFEVKMGEIFGLIGPNGAGKTTAFNIITGNYKTTTGKVIFRNEDITDKKPDRIVRLGIARTFQNIRLFKSMNVLENVLIGFHNHIDYNFFEAIFRFPSFFKEEKKFEEEAIKILETLKIDKFADSLATSLSYGNQRKVEIARALATSPDLLLLDEPVAGMNHTESDELADILQLIKDEYDLTILLIEHDMKFVQKVCDRVVVLDYGKTIFEGKPKAMLNDKNVIKAYLGDFDV